MIRSSFGAGAAAVVAGAGSPPPQPAARSAAARSSAASVASHVRASRSSQLCRRCAAATASSGALPPKRCASAVVKRSSAVSTGTATTARSSLDERCRLGRLLAVLAAQRQRQADDDDLRLVLGDEPRDLGQPGLRRRLADDADGAREGAARVGDGDAGPGSAVVQREDTHGYRATVGISVAAFFSWVLPVFASAMALLTTGVTSASLFPAFSICTALISRAPALPKLTNALLRERLQLRALRGARASWRRSPQRPGGRPS